MPSNYTTVRNAIHTEITNLALTPTPTLKRRKRPRREAGDPDYLIVISGKSAQREAFTAEDAFAYECEYRFLITTIIPNDGAAAAGDTAENYREQIQRRLLTPGVLNTTAPFVSHVTATEKPNYSVSALEKNYDYTPMEVVVTTIESRS